jgi:hypothetical protein
MTRVGSSRSFGLGRELIRVPDALRTRLERRAEQQSSQRKDRKLLRVLVAFEAGKKK